MQSLTAVLHFLHLGPNHHGHVSVGYPLDPNHQVAASGVFGKNEFWLSLFIALSMLVGWLTIARLIAASYPSG
jgi:hypothetical protein